MDIVAIVGGVATVVGGVVVVVVRDAVMAAAVVEGVAAAVVRGAIGGHGNTVDRSGGVLGAGGDEVFGDRGDGAFGVHREDLENKPQLPVQAQKIMHNQRFSPREAGKLRVQKNETRAKSKTTPEQGETDGRPHIMDGVLQHDGMLDQIIETVQTIVDTMGMNDWSKVTNLLLG